MFVVDIVVYCAVLTVKQHLWQHLWDADVTKAFYSLLAADLVGTLCFSVDGALFWVECRYSASQHSIRNFVRP